MPDKDEIYPYRRPTGKDKQPAGRENSPSWKERLVFLRKKLPAWEGKLPAWEGLPTLPRLRWKKEGLIFMVWAFFLGRALLLGEIAPLGPAFLTAVLATAPGLGWFSAAGLIAGQATMGWGYFLPAATLSLTLFFLGRQLPGVFISRRFGGPMLAGALVVVVKAGFLILWQTPVLYDYVLIFTDGLLVALLSWFMRPGVTVLARLLGKTPLKKREELAGFFIIIMGLLAGAAGLEASIFAVGRILSLFIILVAAHTGGAPLGAATGTLVGLVPTLTVASSPSAIGFYALAGVTSGLLKPFGRLGAMVGMVLGVITLSVYFALYSDVVALLGEAALAGCCYLLLPRSFLLGLKNAVLNALSGLRPTSSLDKRQRTVASRRITEISRVFEELGLTFAQMAGEAQPTEEEHLQKLFSGVAAKVCRGCPIYRVCWEKEFYNTYRYLLDMLSVLEFKGLLNEEICPVELQKRCVRIKELLISLGCLYESYRGNRYWSRKVEESRKVVANQLQGLAGIMGEMAEAMKADAEMQEDLETILSREFIKKGIPVNEISVILNEAKKWEIVISRPSCGNKVECVEKIKPLVESVLGERLSVYNNRFCTKKTGEANCEFKLYPGSNLEIRIGVAQKARENVCGDSFGVLELKEGKLLAMLSDGMGVGSRAALESRATITLLEQLMEAGFSHELAVRTVNSTLLLRSPEETFSTVDLAVIDLYNGRTDFIKIGAAASFVKRGREVTMIRSASLPLGILQNIEVEATQKQLAPGDILVMATDGILESGENADERTAWFMDLVREATGKPQAIAEAVLREVLAREGESQGDDMTVLIAAIGNKHAN